MVIVGPVQLQVMGWVCLSLQVKAMLSRVKDKVLTYEVSKGHGGIHDAGIKI